MKKIAIVASGLLWATGIFADGVSSQEIVGYQTKTIKAGFSLNTPTFTDVGSDGIDLSKFKLLNAAGDGTEVIQVLEQDGSCSTIWTWLNTDAGVEKDGWYDNDTWKPISKTVKLGQGYLMSVDADVDLQTAGTVKKNSSVVKLPAGFNVVGNATPCEIDLQNMKLINAAGDGTEVIQVLEQDGSCSTIWTWLNTDAGVEKDGWYDNDTWDPIVKTVKPGTAFLIAVDADTELELPAVVK